MSNIWNILAGKIHRPGQVPDRFFFKLYSFTSSHKKIVTISLDYAPWFLKWAAPNDVRGEDKGNHPRHHPSSIRKIGKQGAKFVPTLMYCVLKKNGHSRADTLMSWAVKISATYCKISCSCGLIVYFVFPVLTYKYISTLRGHVFFHIKTCLYHKKMSICYANLILKRQGQMLIGLFAPRLKLISAWL